MGISSTSHGGRCLYYNSCDSRPARGRALPSSLSLIRSSDPQNSARWRSSRTLCPWTQYVHGTARKSRLWRCHSARAHALVRARGLDRAASHVTFFARPFLFSLFPFSSCVQSRRRKSGSFWGGGLLRMHHYLKGGMRGCDRSCRPRTSFLGGFAFAPWFLSHRTSPYSDIFLLVTRLFFVGLRQHTFGGHTRT